MFAVDGKACVAPARLLTGARVILGLYHVFRFNDPEQARQSRYNLAALAAEPAKTRALDERPIDWRYAQEELYRNQRIDLKEEMDRKLDEVEHNFRKEVGDNES